MRKHLVPYVHKVGRNGTHSQVAEKEYVPLTAEYHERLCIASSNLVLTTNIKHHLKSRSSENGWRFSLMNPTKSQYWQEKSNSYEEALEAGLLTALKLIKL